MFKTFAEWELNEVKYHFDYNHNTYTIHQAETNKSKFGIKKHGKWVLYVRNRIFDPKRFKMEPDEFLAWVQKGIKHFNILGEVTRKDVFESEWKKLFRHELKHNKPINKKYVVLKLHCGKRNARYNMSKNKEE